MSFAIKKVLSLYVKRNVSAFEIYHESLPRRVRTLKLRDKYFYVFPFALCPAYVVSADQNP